MRYEKLAANYLAFVQLASIRLWLRVNESTSWSAPVRLNRVRAGFLRLRKSFSATSPFRQQVLSETCPFRKTGARFFPGHALALRGAGSAKPRLEPEGSWRGSV